MIFQMYCFDFPRSVRGILFYFKPIFSVYGFGRVCFNFRSDRFSSVVWVFDRSSRPYGFDFVIDGVVTSQGGFVLRRVHQWALRLQFLLFSV